jgi:hypothetical protein
MSNSGSGNGSGNRITLNDLIEKADTIEKKINDDNEERITQIMKYRSDVSASLTTIAITLGDIDKLINNLLLLKENGNISKKEIEDLNKKLLDIKTKMGEKLENILKAQTNQDKKLINSIVDQKLKDQTLDLNKSINDIFNKLKNNPNPPSNGSDTNANIARGTSLSMGGRRTTRKIGKKLRRTLTKAKKTLRKLKAKAKKVKKAKKQAYTQKGGYIWPFKQDKGKKGKGKGKNKKTSSKPKRSRLSIF